MDTTEQSPVILSLCTGMRGIERGLERVFGELTVAAYMEIESFVVYNLVKQMEKGVLAPAPIWTDLKTFPAEQFHRKIHGIIGGYPCQPFSCAGERKGSEDERHLWPHIQRIIKATKPLFCFFENVDGHLTLGYDEVYRSLRDMGYAVEAGIYSAEEVGAPHQRDRLFILAVEYTASRWTRGLRDKISERKRYGTSGGSAILRGTEMVNTNEFGCTDEQKGCKQIETDQERKLPIDERSRQDKQCGISKSSEDVANTHSSRSGENWEQSKLRTGCSEQPPFNRRNTRKRKNSEGRFDRWPATPGQDQYEWEESRVKSKLGFTVDGHNFREDLLRLAGNGVVEQTAEIAFMDLLGKIV